MARTLNAVPNLVPLYVKAATSSAKKRPNPIETKVDELAVNGVTVDADRDQGFRDVVGASKSEQAFFGHVRTPIMPVQMGLVAAGDFPLPVMGLIHTENVYRGISPVTLGGKVNISARMAALHTHRSGTEVVPEPIVASSTSGATLVEEQSVYPARGVRLKDVKGFGEVQAQRKAIKSDAGTIEREQSKVPSPIAQWKLADGAGHKQAKASGDWNPTHITSVSTRALGIPATIVHGMYTASRALAEAQVLPGQSYKFQISFGAPIVLSATTNVILTHAGGDASATHGLTNSSSNIGHAVNIIVWSRKKKCPHFTGSVRPLEQLMRKRCRKRRTLESQPPH